MRHQMKKRGLHSKPLICRLAEGLSEQSIQWARKGRPAGIYDE